MKDIIKHMVIIILLFFITFNLPVAAQGFLKVSDRKIINGFGQEVILKGIGLGGWLLQEGYMLHTSGFANAQWEIKKKIMDLVGTANAEAFYDAYRQNYVRKIDIDSIKSWGFNSVRLPFHYNLFVDTTNPGTFIDEGFLFIDSLLSWCKFNQLYLILDLHACPGGQSANAISDYNPGLPSLWESEVNKDLTVKVWRIIAERYANEEWIGGYDLINEPAWNLGTGNQPLRDLFIRITDTVRAVDQNHILFIEGNWYATDFAGLTPPWDENMVYSFHKYWNSNDQGAIQYLVNLRNDTNRPLWLGETGENSNAWFVDCAELMKNNNIGWAWWPHKKIESIAGPLSSPKTSGYQTLLDYWNGQGPQPSVSFAMNALMSQAEKLKIEECKYQKDVIDALFRQVSNNSTIQYADNQIPGIIYAVDYDMGKRGYAYMDNGYQQIGSGSWNSGWLYRNDGVDIEACSDPFLSNGFNVGWIEHGEWLKFTATVNQNGLYDINFGTSGFGNGGKIYLKINGVTATEFLDVPNTGGFQNWQTITASDVYIPAGVQSFEIRFLNGGFNFNSMEFIHTVTGSEGVPDVPREFRVDQNYPNPFNPATTISYSIPSDGNVRIVLYDMMGNMLYAPINEYKSPGIHSYRLNAQEYELSSGVYFVNLSFEEKLFETIKLVLMK
jgi:endoglucanase